MRIRKFPLLLAILLLNAMLLAGCGGGGTSTPTSMPASSSGSGDATATATTTTTAAAPTAPATVAVSSTQDGPPSPPTTAATASGKVAAARDADPEAPAAEASFDLPAGWSIVSFPFSRLDAVQGLRHQIYTWRDGRYEAVDAAADPSAVDTRLAWFVYVESATHVTASGAKQTAEAVDDPLQPGWNLVANPFDHDVVWGQLDLAVGDATRSLPQAAASSDADGASISDTVHGYANGAAVGESVQSARLPAYGGRWVQAWHECDIRMSLSSAPRAIDTRAVTTGTVTGQVQSTTGALLRNASIVLDSGQSAISATDGSFRIYNVPAGTRSVTISASGYNTARGTITVTAGQTRSVLVTLSPTTPPVTTGTLYVSAYAWYYGGKRYWVSKIEVYEYNNYSKRWSNNWWSDLGYSRYDLTCGGANIGKGYNVVITWKNAAGTTYTRTFYRTFSRSGQVEYFYNP